MVVAGGDGVTVEVQESLISVAVGGMGNAEGVEPAQAVSEIINIMIVNNNFCMGEVLEIKW